MKAYRPQNWGQLKDVLVHFPRNAVFAAGGTDLILQLQKAAIEPENLIYLGNMPELKQIKKYEEGFFIGAACTMSELSANPLLTGAYSSLAEAAGSVGSVQVRNKATIGGNIAHASAAADMAAPLMCLDAAAVIVRSGWIVNIPVSELITGNEKTILGMQDVILGFLLPLYNGQTVSHYYKLAFRKEVSVSRFGIAVMMEYKRGIAEKVSVYVSAIGPKAVRMQEIEELICGAPLTGTVIKEAGRMLSAYIGATSKRKYKMWAAESVMTDALRPFLQISEKGVDENAAAATGGL